METVKSEHIVLYSLLYTCDRYSLMTLIFNFQEQHTNIINKLPGAASSCLLWLANSSCASVKKKEKKKKE